MTRDGGAPRVVVVGGGIVGCAVAYYLAKRGQSCTVIEKDGIAAAASGKAGGFLALDWNDSSPVGPLSRLSYRMHATLEEELGVDLGYRCMDTFSVEATDRGNVIEDLLGGGHAQKALGNWVDGHVKVTSEVGPWGLCPPHSIQVDGVQRLGSPSTTAQVHPRKLTEAFMAKATALAGSQWVQGAVRDVRTSSGGEGAEPCVTGVSVGDRVIDADVVVIAMGPWSQLASAWLPLPMAISGQKYHSLLLQPSSEVPPAALFTHVRRAGLPLAEPEIYPRPDHTVYVCGEPSSPPLPPSASEVLAHGDSCDRILSSVSTVASCLGTAEVIARQACFLPLTPDGLPVIGEVKGVCGAFVASGHSCWGILNAPASGLLMAELILDGRTSSLDISKFSPKRFAGI